jgi:hypothetical protein
MAAFLVTTLMLVSPVDTYAANPVPFVNQPLVPDTAAPWAGIHADSKRHRLCFWFRGELEWQRARYHLREWLTTNRRCGGNGHRRG